MPKVTKLTPVKAIRAKCLDCCCGSPSEVRLCPCTDCQLYPYRMGRNPNCGSRVGKLAGAAKMRASSGDSEQEGLL